MKNVTMLTCQLMPEVFGGAEQQCIKQSKALVFQGVSITVLTSRSSTKVLAEEYFEGVPVKRLFSFFPPQELGFKIGASFFWLIKVLLYFRKHQDHIDVIHVHQGKFQAFVAVIAKQLFNIPVVVKVGAGGTHFDIASLHRKKIIGPLLAKKVLLDVDVFVAISQEIYDDFLSWGVEKDRVVKVFNCVDVPEITNDKNISDVNTFVFSGRLEKQKNVLSLLKAFKKLLHIDSSAKLVILGDGALKQELTAYCDQDPELSRSVTFAGYVSNVSDYLSASKFFVLPSLAEGMSNSVLEAMSYGCVPISTRVSGASDLINHEVNGWLVNVGDIEDLFMKLKDAISVSDENYISMSRNAYEFVLQNNSPLAISKKYIEIYRKLNKE